MGKTRFPDSGTGSFDHGACGGAGSRQLLSFIEAWWREKNFAPSRAACLEEAKKKLNAR
jgi:hypothetical protein